MLLPGAVPMTLPCTWAKRLQGYFFVTDGWGSPWPRRRRQRRAACAGKPTEFFIPPAGIADGVWRVAHQPLWRDPFALRRPVSGCGQAGDTAGPHQILEIRPVKTVEQGFRCACQGRTKAAKRVAASFHMGEV